MASGISFLAGLLTGAATGVEQGKKIKLAKEENEIRRQQVQATKELGFAQIGATKAQHAASLALQEKLGLLGADIDRERIGLGREELGVRREESASDRALRMLMQDTGFQHDIRMSGIASKYQTEFAEIQAGLRERGAEADYGREIEGAGIKARIGLTLDKERMDHEAALRKEFAALTGEDLKGKIQLKAADAIWDLRTAMVGRKLSDDAEMAQIMPKLTSTVVASLAAAQRPASEISTAIAAIKQLANDIKGGNDDSARKLAPMMQAVMEGDPSDPATQAKVNEFFKQVMAAPEPTPVSGGETGGGGKTGLTKTPASQYTQWAKQNPRAASISGENRQLRPGDGVRIVLSIPGLRELALQSYIKSQKEVYGSSETTPSDARLGEWVEQVLNQIQGPGTPAARAARAFGGFDRAEWDRSSQRSSGGGTRDPVYSDSGTWNWESCSAGICTWRNSATGETMKLPKGQRPLQ